VPIALDLIQPLTLLGLIGFTLVTGFSAGLYPAFVVAKMNPIKILSGFNSPLGGGFKLKRILLVFQLTISGVLVFSVLTLQMHVKKMNQFDFGYDNTDLLAFEVGEKNVKNNFLAVREAIAKMPGVSQISGGPFPYNINGYADVNYAAADTLLTESAGRIYVALDFLSLTNVPIISGSHFGGLPSGELSQVCIVNEAFALAIGRDILGESITIDGKLKRIVGISKNYTVWGISSPEGVSQVFLPVDEPKYHSLLVKVDPLQRKNVLAGLEDIWRTYEPILEPKVSELDVAIDESIERQSKITSLFGFLALVVLVLSLMNLFGVSLMYARSKLKNISIRRILGAETFELFSKLIRPFLYALLISLFISIPIGYWLMEGYLADFAVRIDLSFMQGLMVSVIMLLAILLVAGVQMIRTSNVDPVAVLKDQ